MNPETCTKAQLTEMILRAIGDEQKRLKDIYDRRFGSP